MQVCDAGYCFKPYGYMVLYCSDDAVCSIELGAGTPNLRRPSVVSCHGKPMRKTTAWSSEALTAFFKS